MTHSLNHLSLLLPSLHLLLHKALSTVLSCFLGGVFFFLVSYGCIGSSLLLVGFSLVAVCEFLIAVASLVTEHGSAVVVCGP